MKKITLRTKNISLTADLIDTDLSAQISEKAPFSSKVSTWGEEIYFQVPVDATSSKGTLDVNIGDVAYWLERSCLCVFFGQTPVSVSEKPVPASEVEIVGKITEGLELLKDIRSGENITVETS